MMQSTKYRNCDDLALGICFRNGYCRWYRNLTRDALMWSRSVEVGNIFLDHALKVTLVQEGVGSLEGGAQDVNSTGSTLEFGAIVPVVVVN